MLLSVKKPPRQQVLFFIVIFLAACTGCGKIGDPIPRDIVLVRTVTDLTAKVEQKAIILKWSFPDRPDRVTKIRILRHGRNAREDCSTCPREYTPLVDAEVNDARFQRSDKGSLSYRDGDIKSGFSYSYLIVTCDNLNYCSEKSNMAETDFQEKD